MLAPLPDQSWRPTFDRWSVLAPTHGSRLTSFQAESEPYEDGWPWRESDSSVERYLFTPENKTNYLSAAKPNFVGQISIVVPRSEVPVAELGCYDTVGEGTEKRERETGTERILMSQLMSSRKKAAYIFTHCYGVACRMTATSSDAQAHFADNYQVPVPTGKYAVPGEEFDLSRAFPQYSSFRTNAVWMSWIIEGNGKTKLARRHPSSSILRSLSIPHGFLGVILREQDPIRP